VTAYVGFCPFTRIHNNNRLPSNGYGAAWSWIGLTPLGRCVKAFSDIIISMPVLLHDEDWVQRNHIFGVCS
jgi:hypothetical protein